MDFTDPTYEIPKLTALWVVKELTNGANRPLLVRGVLQDSGVKIDCVVKPNGGERMGEPAMLRELLAAFMAQVWGIRVVEPVLVDITPEILSTVQDKPCFATLSKSLGWNFGSIYLARHTQLLPGQMLSGNRLDQARKIAAFDLIVQNPDRRHSNPNLLTDGEELVILDHELAFSFTQLLFPTSDPWKIERDKWIDDMLLLPLTRRNPLSDAEILIFLGLIKPDFWTKVKEVLPTNLSMLPELEKIIAYFEALKHHKQAFLHHLKIAAFA